MSSNDAGAEAVPETEDQPKTEDQPETDMEDPDNYGTLTIEDPDGDPDESDDSEGPTASG